MGVTDEKIQRRLRPRVQEFFDWPRLNTWLGAQTAGTKAILYGTSDLAGVFVSDGTRALLDGEFNFAAGGDFGLTIGTDSGDHIEHGGTGTAPSFGASGLSFGQADGEVILNFLKVTGEQLYACGKVACAVPTEAASQMIGVGVGEYHGCLHAVAGINWHRGALESGTQVAGVGATNQVASPDGDVVGIGAFVPRNRSDAAGNGLTGFAFATGHTGVVYQAAFSNRTVQTSWAAVPLTLYADAQSQGDFAATIQSIKATGGYST